MLCANCNTNNNDYSTYCATCGAPLRNNVSYSYNAPANQPAAHARKSNNMVVALGSALGVTLVAACLTVGLFATGVIGGGNQAAASVAAAANAANTANPANVSVNVSYDGKTASSQGTSTQSAPAASTSSSSTYTYCSAPAPSTSGKDSSYTIADSNSRVLSTSEIKKYDTYTLYLARNEIYARHGRQFVRTDLQSHFNTKSWYCGTIAPDAFDEGCFNSVERTNVQRILEVEKSRNSQYL